MSQPSIERGAAAGVAASVERRYPIEFTAEAGEYFRIWIVNLALTVLTLGIYSAWAKVRKRRYFYGHTRIDGEGFEYRANPVAILKGRLIAVAVFAAFYAVNRYAPLYVWVLYLVLLVVGPWLAVRSLAYNAYNSAYRNVRLAFSGTYGACLKIVLGHGLLTLVTLGLGFPFLKRRLVQFAMENHSYGTTRFTLAEGFKKPFVRPYFVVFGVSILLGLALVGLFVAMGTMAGAPPKPGAGAPAWMMKAIFIGIAAFYALLFLQVAYIKARTMNAVWNHLAIGPVRFDSALRARDLLWIYFSNLVVLALTIGLAAPWATVRAARYRASKTAVIAAGPLDSFAQAQAQSLGAAGEEIGEMFDFDIAL
jgi:uncharacterized membrane protein YjgN (DUF898 family)